MGLGAKVYPSARTLFRRLGSESLLLELDRGLYFGLDEVATTIWQAFERQMSLEQTLDVLEASYAAQRAHLEVDLLTFVRTALDEKLVEVSR